MRFARPEEFLPYETAWHKIDEVDADKSQPLAITTDNRFLIVFCTEEHHTVLFQNRVAIVDRLNALVGNGTVQMLRLQAASSPDLAMAMAFVSLLEDIRDEREHIRPQ